MNPGVGLVDRGMVAFCWQDALQALGWWCDRNLEFYVYVYVDLEYAVYTYRYIRYVLCILNFLIDIPDRQLLGDPSADIANRYR